MAVASLHAGTRNVRPQASALICCHTALRAPPPSEYTVSAGQPRAFSMPKKSRSRNATDSITLRAKWARVVGKPRAEEYGAGFGTGVGIHAAG